jgi:uncharacterized protein
LKTVIVISDTHSYIDNGILKYCAEADEVWHAGDIGRIEILDGLKKTSLKAVYGNIDDQLARREYPLYIVFTTEKFRVLITHIGGSPPLYNTNAKSLINEFKPDIFVCGHSHILKIQKDGSMLYINPGAAGTYGFHKIRTIVRLVLDSGKIVSVEVIELGNRKKN